MPKGFRPEDSLPLKRVLRRAMVFCFSLPCCFKMFFFKTQGGYLGSWGLQGGFERDLFTEPVLFGTCLLWLCVQLVFLSFKGYF